MQYQRFQDTIAVRLDPGDEICQSLAKVCQEQGILLGEISGLGAVRQVLLGAYKVADQTFYPLSLERELEMASLTGTVTQQEGKPYLHLHAVFGDETGAVFAGHLKSAVIGGTGEIMIRILSGQIGRKTDPVTGLQIWDFTEEHP